MKPIWFTTRLEVQDETYALWLDYAGNGSDDELEKRLTNDYADLMKEKLEALGSKITECTVAIIR